MRLQATTGGQLDTSRSVGVPLTCDALALLPTKIYNIAADPQLQAVPQPGQRAVETQGWAAVGA